LGGWGEKKVGLLLNCNPSSFGMCDAIFRVNSFVGVSWDAGVGLCTHNCTLQHVILYLLSGLVFEGFCLDEDCGCLVLMKIVGVFALGKLELNWCFLMVVAQKELQFR